MQHMMYAEKSVPGFMEAEEVLEKTSCNNLYSFTNIEDSDNVIVTNYSK